VLAISRFTADELCRLGGFDPRRIEVVHNGCDFVGGPAPVEQPIAEFDGEPFFLFVGSLEPGKNLALLRQVYEVAAARGLELPRLRIVGARWPGVEREGRPPGQWTYHGHLPDAQLVFLYRRALALVFPSKYEGFGLPLVEAMALGCPVVGSPVASLPEVGGEAVRWVEPVPEAYLEALRELAGSAAERAGWIDAGTRRAERFTWRRCAEETAEVYRSAVRFMR
jgi:alpha-1,3-rhamnosyl/mannosyltransferase